MFNIFIYILSSPAILWLTIVFISFIN